MVVVDNLQRQTTNVSKEQYQWLKARLGSHSDIVACEMVGITKDRLRRWKQNPSFNALLELVRSNSRLALQALALVLAGMLQLEAIERLLMSDKGSDVKAGLDVLDRLKKDIDSDDDHSSYKQIINILNLRGDLPGEVIDLLPAPMRRLSEQNPI